MAFEIFVIILCLSFDALLASFSYGINRIKIPLKSMIIINLVITITFILAMVIGEILSDFINPSYLNIISFFILFSLAILKFFEYSIKKYFCNIKNKSFKLYNMSFILSVVSDSTLADVDKSKELNCKEAISLGLALSLDGICAALSIGLLFNNYLLAFIYSFSITFLMFIIGNKLGNKISRKKDINLSWFSGLILLILSITKII